jgi:hypothetical protein
MVNASRKVAAGQHTAPAAPASLTGVLVNSALPAVSGRGRKAEPIPAELVANLTTTREQPGKAIEFAGDASAVDKFQRTTRKWAEQETENGTPTTMSFRTLKGNLRKVNPKSGEVTPATASITILAAAVRKDAEVIG